MTDTEQDRAAFEAWISAPPMQKNTERYPESGTELIAFPSQYRNVATQLAWEAWQACGGSDDGLLENAMWLLRDWLKRGGDPDEGPVICKATAEMLEAYGLGPWGETAAIHIERLGNRNSSDYARGLRDAAAVCRADAESQSQLAMRHSRPVYVSQCHGGEEALNGTADRLDALAVAAERGVRSEGEE